MIYLHSFNFCCYWSIFLFLIYNFSYASSDLVPVISSMLVPNNQINPDPTSHPPQPSAPSQPAVLTPPARPRPSRAQVLELIPPVASHYGVEEALVRAVIAAESNYNAYAISHAGAIGLMQIMPATAGDYGVHSAEALFDPQTNLRTGIRHLKRLLKKYNNDYGRVIMAYNAGEGAVDRTNSKVTYLETLNYTETVLKNYVNQGGSTPTQTALNQVQTLRSERNPHQAKQLLQKYLDSPFETLKIKPVLNASALQPSPQALQIELNHRQSKKLLKKHLDPALLSLTVKPTLDNSYLNPALHAAGPETRPMFELDTKMRH